MGRIATRFVVLVAFVITASMMGAPVEARVETPTGDQ